MTNAISLETILQAVPTETIGLDLSDKLGTYVVVDQMGMVSGEGKVVLTKGGLGRFFGRREPARIAIEVGAHSPWVDRELRMLGYEVIVANARQVKLITQSKKKNDREDAETLARLARLDPKLLKPVTHRGEQAQADLAILRSRDGLIRARTLLINHVRGAAKAAGTRLPKCSAESFAARMQDRLPDLLKQALEPLLASIASLTEQIKDCTSKLEKLAEKRYPETSVLRQIKGVGLLTSLAFLLILEEAERFANSRSVGAFLGLTTRQHQSGESQPQLHITKEGDSLLRRLLVQSAQYILGPFGPDSELRRWGLKLAGQGNKIRKRKAIVAVARKLATLLHRLWTTGEVYEPLRTATLAKEAA
jgi:transposase